MTDNPYIELVAEGLCRQKSVRLFFSGSSMLPALKEGMQVVVESCTHDRINPAELILYRYAGGMVIHRVVGLMRKGSETIFLTRGDNQGYIAGESVSQADLLGVVRSAFLQGRPGRDMLYKDKITGIMYVKMNGLILQARRLEGVAPACMKGPMRFFLRLFFFILLKSIHLIYSGVRYYGVFFYRKPGIAIAG